MFSVENAHEYCAFHQANGHSTRAYIRLRDVLEKLARQGELIPYISKEFFKKHRKVYNGKGKQFKNPIKRKDDYSEDDQEDNDRRRHATPPRHSTPTINVIAGGVPQV